MKPTECRSARGNFNGYEIGDILGIGIWFGIGIDGEGGSLVRFRFR